jgi:D-glycero-alpha-D-manno-heptose 1-phosphate guanylyltransferase
MEAVVLAGGLGTRLRSAVMDVPKPMAPIAGRPFLEILLGSLARKGFNRVILSVGYMADSIVNYFGNCYQGLTIEYAVETKPLGTGGGLRLAMGMLTSDHVFVFNGDTFVDLEVDELELYWQTTNRPVIVGRHVSDASRYGHILRNHDVVTGFVEKGIVGAGLINAGCYVLPKGQLDAFGEGEFFSLELDFLIPSVMRCEFNIFETRGLFIDIGIPSDYIRAQVDLIGY